MTEIKTAPYWWEAAPPSSSPAIKINSVCDVVVVGAGYAGLSAAITLGRAGRFVQVFDRQLPGEGASTRNGGLASGNIKMSFRQMTERFGLKHAKAVYLEGKIARQKLSDFIHAESLDCDFKLTGRFVAAYKPEHYETQAREADFINKHLEVGAYMIPREDQHNEIETDMYFGGMLRPDLGGLHPAKFHAGLLTLARDAGVSIFGNCPITQMSNGKRGFEAKTSLGKVIAENIIVSTNGYTDSFDKWLRRRLVPVTSRLVATEPLPTETISRLMPKGRMFGETRTLFHYFRQSPDGTRILMGGSEGGNSGDPNQDSKKLKNYISQVFPALPKIRLSHYWTGNVAFNMDFQPRLFSQKGITYATGFCGSGVVWAWWVGQKAANKLLENNQTGTVFEGPPPMAIPFYNGKPWFMPAAMLWFKIQDYLGSTSKK